MKKVLFLEKTILFHLLMYVLIGQLHNFSNSSPHYALKVPPTLQQLRRQFKRFDDNGDGKISRKEFEVMAEQCYYDLLKK